MPAVIEPLIFAASRGVEIWLTCKLAASLASRLARHAIALGGTCTGEHGIGFGKTPYMIEEFGESGVALVRTLNMHSIRKGF